MTVAIRPHPSASHMMFLFLSFTLIATTWQGVHGETDVEGPSESQCRPYIEKALKQLETGDTSAALVQESPEDGDASDIYDTTKLEQNDSESNEEITDSVDAEISENVEDVISASDEVEAYGEQDQNKAQEINNLSHEIEIEQLETSVEKLLDTESNISSDENKQQDSNEDIHKESQEIENVKKDVSVVDSEETQRSHEQFENVDDHSEGIDELEVVSSESEKKIDDSTEAENEMSIQDMNDGENEAGAESKESTEVQTSLEKEVADVQEYTAESYTSIEELVASEETHKQEQTESNENEQTESVQQLDDSSEHKNCDDKKVNDENASIEQSEMTAKDVVKKDTSDEKDNEITETESVSAETQNISTESENSIFENVKSEETLEAVSDDIKEELKASEDNIIELAGTKIEMGDEQEVSEVNKSEAEVELDEMHAHENISGEQIQNVLHEGESTQELVDMAASENSLETLPEEELMQEFDIPTDLRSRDHINQLLHLDEEYNEKEMSVNKVADVILRELKRLYENAIKPLEILYKYRDLSNRHFGDPEIFSKPLVLFMGPWSGGKSSIINYLLDNEYKSSSLRTGAEPSPAYFNIVMWGEEPEVLDGTQLAADWTFSGLQKFGQGLEDRLRGLKLPSKLLEKINIVEIPGILEVRKQVSRMFPFNDACQWFIDRADIIFLVYDPSKLDVGPETEAILDQLKGREYQTRIILNKADQVKPEELMRVQGALIWNISPLMSSAQPPVMYTTSLWSRPYETSAPVRLLQAQETAFLKDLRTAVDKRIENKISSARRFAVRVRNHAKMVDCYLTTYYNHKSMFGNKKLVADQIIERPQDYHIYEGLSTLTNISRYDLPDPDVYRDFFHLNPLYDFQQLSATCTYFRGCPINRLDVAIAYDLPELVGKYKKMTEQSRPAPSNS